MVGDQEISHEAGLEVGRGALPRPGWRPWEWKEDRRQIPTTAGTRCRWVSGSGHWVVPFPGKSRPEGDADLGAGRQAEFEGPGGPWGRDLELCAWSLAGQERSPPKSGREDGAGREEPWRETGRGTPGLQSPASSEPREGRGH